MKTRLGSVACLGMAGLALASPLRAQVEIKSNAAEITLGGRLQMQAVTSSCSGFPLGEHSTCSRQTPDVNWFVRRARLTLEAKLSDKIEGKIQTDFGDLNEVQVKDAYGRLLFSAGAHLTLGHFKRPFDGFEMTSSTKILTIERDLDIPGVSGLTAASLDELTTRFRLSDRDVGIMLDGRNADGSLHYWIATFNGQGPEDNADIGDGKQLIGRGQYALAVAGHPLKLAGAAALTGVPFTRNDGALDAEYFTAFELWSELGDFNAGPHLQAGFVFGENPLQNEAGGAIDLPAGEDFANMRTWQVIGSYKVGLSERRFVKAIEPLFRVTRANPNTDVADDEVWGLTPGVQLFFDGRNKVAVNWDFAVFSDGSLDTENSFKMMYFFHF